MGVRAREIVLDRFAWIDGHADVWAIFRDADALRAVVKALADPFRGERIAAVCGIESRGFLLGGAAAVELGVGFVPVRKANGLFPGAKATRATAPDYRGVVNTLRLQRASLTPGDRVVLVDDWIQTGSQVQAVHALVAECGARLVGCSVIVDELTDERRSERGLVHALVRADELPRDGG
ncbi:phosphoribosyltransferase family protein [Labedaea rhizosphaerae]|uniref:adenine phosphoribosyltransferase n=1 Tax=Labedaea rhizosphaerae TaxID=598644 RepID=A0A4R6SHH7_LABRH|nr:phosphoribosyltransferase family protein [Labedaea rhizosphaerae]TDQ00816.1 adenine phosphoribosyltransferase [Labedaea rhizosphaerae]